MEPEARSSTHGSRFSYPVLLDLRRALVVVVGGGAVGARKSAGLAASGARVRLVARRISEHVDLRDIAEIRERAFTPVDLNDARLVITATGRADVDAAVAAAARLRNVWVNAADQPSDCDFILPATHRTGRVTAAIGTDGASPALACWLRDRVAELLTDDVGALAEQLALERRRIHASGESTESRDWISLIESTLVGRIPGA